MIKYPPYKKNNSRNITPHTQVPKRVDRPGKTCPDPAIYLYGRVDHHHVLCHSNTTGNMGVEMINWIMNILLGVLITLAVLCLIQMAVNFYTLGWY